jgi:tetratricopeptide (TPR) repeat protein
MYQSTVRLIAALPERRPSVALPSRLDMLFRQLAAADGDADSLEESIWSIWMHHPNRRVATAIDKAATDIAAKRFDIAETRLALLVSGCPSFPEAWHKRAILNYLRESDAESVEDLHRTLALEPRHFPALLAFGEICLSAGETDGAALAFRAALRLHPRLQAAMDGLDRIDKNANNHDDDGIISSPT